MASYYPHSFEAPVTTHDVGSSRYVYKVVFLPQEVASDLPLDTYPRLRVTGEIGGHPYEGSCTPVRGRHYLLLSKTFLALIDAEVGDEVEVRLAVADQNAVAVPTALLHALQENPDMQEIWNGLSPGKQRGLAHVVASAKTPPTIVKRINQVFDMMTGKRDARGQPIKR